MTIPRRFLPPTSLLTAFEAAARTQSFTLAAKKLDLTQSAVSRQIRALEDILGTQLFHREKQQVKLTLAGSAYAREVRDALRRVSDATLSFRANPEGKSLRLAVLPLLAARWLIPRLPAFQAAYPGVTINLFTRLAPFDFALDTVDAAIHFGPADWPGAELTYLMDEQVLPVCSPTLRQSLNPTSPADLRHAPLLHLASRPDAWEGWFGAMHVDPGNVRGVLFDQFTLIIEAARHGLGVAMLPDFLIRQELQSGELVAAVQRPMISKNTYYLASPNTLKDQEPLDSFRKWLSAQAAGLKP